MEAHRIVLASSSPFFMELLRNHKRTSPLIFIKGVKYEDLVAIVDFLYVGAANVFQENLDSFLAIIASELQLRGLTWETIEEENPRNEQELITENKLIG